MKTALILVDIQNDFCPGGPLAVAEGDQIVPIVNSLRESLQPDVVALTQDWHPADHTSFITNNPGETVYKPRADGQMMWPNHCEQFTNGAMWHPALTVLSTDYIAQKGMNKDVDSYSGFGAEDKSLERTELEYILRKNSITRVVVVGLAYDYCVSATAKDSAALGFETIVVKSATRSIAADTVAKETQAMLDAGVKIVETVEDLLVI